MQHRVEITPQSLFQKVRILVTIIFISLVITTTAILIWSYYITYEYVKLHVLITPPSITKDNISSYSDITSSISLLSNFEIIFTEFNLSYNAIVSNFWNGTAYTCALALIASMYIYPYIKLIIYIIVYFIPLKPKYQFTAIFHINQWNKFLFIPFVAVLVQSSTFSFTIVPPTHILQDLAEANAEAYPATGIVVNLIILFCYAIFEYFLMFMIKTDNKWIVSPQRVHNDNPFKNDELSISARSEIDSRSEYIVTYKISKRYESKSYFDMIYKSIFLVIVIGNAWLILEAICTVSIRFKLDGVLSMFIPDKHIANNVVQIGNILLNTSLLNDAAAWFMYFIWMIVFVINPCIISMILCVIWITPLFNKTYGFKILPKYLLPILWFIQSWNALDIYLICNFGASMHNIKNGTKYLLDNKFPQYCGDDGLVTNIFGMDCSWADAWFTYGLIIIIASILIQWFIIYQTEKVFGTNHDNNAKSKQGKKMSINT